MDNLISIIIPVYNVEIFLPKCIESVINQSYRNLEIILVDDGSTDKSGQICNQYMEKDQRIKVIHKSREGVTSARKAGLRISTGNYIGFVDSDDWIDIQMYEVLLKEAIDNNADIVTSGRFVERDNDYITEYDGLCDGVYNVEKEDDSCLNNMIFLNDSWDSGILRALWNKLFRRDIIMANYMDLDDRIIRCEDMAVLIASFLISNRIVVLHEIFYHYRQREGSLKRSRDELYYERINAWYSYIKQKISGTRNLEILRKKIDRLMATLIIDGFSTGFEFWNDELISKYRFPVNNLKKKQKIVIYGAGIVGKSFYKQFTRDDNYSVMLWVDKNYQDYNEEIKPITSIKEIEYDNVIIAVNSDQTACKIKEELKNIGIKEEKIIWKKPVNILEEICF